MFVECSNYHCSQWSEVSFSSELGMVRKRRSEKGREGGEGKSKEREEKGSETKSKEREEKGSEMKRKGSEVKRNEEKGNEGKERVSVTHFPSSLFRCSFQSLLFLFGESIVLIPLALYLDEVLPKEFGVKTSPLFFLDPIRNLLFSSSSSKDKKSSKGKRERERDRENLHADLMTGVKCYFFF